MIALDNVRWKPLGKGRIAPAGSIADKVTAGKLAEYKTQVAGKYKSVAPENISSAFHSGEYYVSPKIDGETWFLSASRGIALLLSPSSKIITDVPVTEEAASLMGNNDVLLAGELYANGKPTRAHVHDLHAALGGGVNAKIDRLHFAAFDLLEYNDANYQKHPFQKRAEMLVEIMSIPGSAGSLPALNSASYCQRAASAPRFCYSVSFEKAVGAQGVAEAYNRHVVQNGHEGIVVRSATGQIFKIKPEITIDAVAVGFSERAQGGVAELLLALMRPDGSYQLIGRVDTGFTNADRFDLAQVLQNSIVESSYLAASRSGALYRFVKPEVVIEVKCNDLLSIRSSGESICRMALQYNDIVWHAIHPAPAISMINAVFRRIRDDKLVTPDAIRWSQVTDLVYVKEESVGAIELPRSTLLRREVFTKANGNNTCIRKAVTWKTNKEKVDNTYPAYVAFYSDFAPSRQEPLKTDIRVASSIEKINAIANKWLQENITKGWYKPDQQRVNNSTIFHAYYPEWTSCSYIEISFARSGSVNFPVAARRIKALAQHGESKIEHDNNDRPRFYSIKLPRGSLVKAIRRVENLYRLIHRWKSFEFSLNGDPLGPHEIQSVFNSINEIAACWRSQKRAANNGDNPCLKSCTLGCKESIFRKSTSFPDIPREQPAWYAVGEFDGKASTIDKNELLSQLDNPINEKLLLCPFFNHDEVKKRIDQLPTKLDPEVDSARWIMGYTNSHEPAWVFPKNIKNLPFIITLNPEREPVKKVVESLINATSQATSIFSSSSLPSVKSSSIRNIPAARYSDVCGQDAAVEAVRDYAELPLKHCDLFKHIGIQPGRGILLWGPPGNGKTLLARAVAGESGSHIETISGPECLSKWVGEAERNLRETFDRARQYAPSVILMDELDAIAGSRDTCDFHHQREIVSQLLVLMDGLSDRGRVLIIATTNYPQSIDPAILRPGRIDKKVFLGPPSKPGRSQLFTKLLTGKPITDDINPDKLSELTDGLSCAEIEHIVNEAGLLAIKEAISENKPPDNLNLNLEHISHAIKSVRTNWNQVSVSTHGSNAT